MFDWLANTRQRCAERMDEPSADEGEVRRSLRFIQRINQRLGYTQAVLHHLEQFSKGWPAGARISMVDLATGSADIPRAILRWADGRGLDIRIVGVDRHPLTARLAAEGPPDPRLSIIQADVFALPLAERSFDYALCSMFLHHLDEEQVVEVLRSMDRLARRGVIVSDLLRHRRAYAWVRLMTVFSTPMVRHDGPASVAQAFTRREAIELRDRARVSYAQYHRHFGHRFVLAGER